MQLAILLVLILIAVLIAPWLLGVIAIAVSLYGTYIVIGAVITAAVLIATLVWFFFTSALEGRRREKPEIIIGERKACRVCQSEMAASATKCQNCNQTET